MKKILIIAMAFVGLQMNAQDQKRDQIIRDRHDRMAMMYELSAEELATLKTKKMTLQLDLSAAQQKKVKAVVLEESKMQKSRMAEIKTKKDAGTMEKPSKEQRLKMMNERLDRKIAFKAKMKEILDDDQYARWENSILKRTHKRGLNSQRKESKRK